MTPIRVLPVCLLLFAASTVGAADHADQAERAAAAGRDAVTVFVDVDFGGREDRAAKALTQAHAAFQRFGYELVDVESYNENGDLQGFFASYRRKPAATGAQPGH